MEELEEGFIRDESLEKEEVKELIQRIRNFAEVDNDGYVRIKEKINHINLRKKAMLVLSSRYLANRLQTLLDREEKISGEVKSSEIADMLNKDNAVINARMKELKDDNKVENTSRGVYKVRPKAIDSFIEKLEGEVDE